jgi:hypothetical protein
MLTNHLSRRRRCRSPCVLAALLCWWSFAACTAPQPTASENVASLEAMVERLKADLAKQHTARVEDISVVSAQAVVWRDTSLGCGKPTESYAQVEVEGFHIVLIHEGQRFDYRARRDGQFMLCPPGLARARSREP